MIIKAERIFEYRVLECLCIIRPVYLSTEDRQNKRKEEAPKASSAFFNFCILSIHEMPEAGQSKLGTPLTFVSFSRRRTATKILVKHVPQLISGFADYQALTSWSPVDLSPAQAALVPKLTECASFNEIRGLRNARRTFCGSLEPVLEA